VGSVLGFPLFNAPPTAGH